MIDAFHVFHVKHIENAQVTEASANNGLTNPFDDVKIYPKR